MSSPLYPPLGIFPRLLWVERRVKELDAAIKRYTEAKWPVPMEWVDEYNDHVEYLRARVKISDQQECSKRDS